MIITIIRYCIRPNSIDGYLLVDGDYICDTAENPKTALNAGTYEIRILKCHQHARKMPVIFSHSVSESHCNHPDEKLSLSQGCDSCEKLPFVGGNTTLPVFCPQFCPGNGIDKRHDGSIILGTYIVPGCLKHPKQAFDSVYDRLRKSAARGHQITLTIINEYLV